MKARSTRRSFLSAAGLAGLSAGIAASPSRALGQQARAASGATVPFYGAHQSGITTPTPEHVQFATLDLVTEAVSDLRGLLQELSAAAARLAKGQPVGALQTGDTPPVDTGETAGLGAANLTITFGLGPSVFARGRFGLSGSRPAPLVDLPAFSTDALQPGISGGDIGIQACADDPQVAFHAVHDLIRLASPAAVPRWSLTGFGRTANTRAQQTPRNLMGFKDGTNNIKMEDAAALNGFVWARAPESPAWMAGGTYMVVRRIAMLLGRWDDVGLAQQEQTFGRHKLSGAPLGGVHEHDRINLRATHDGRPVIPEDAHIRRASPSYNAGQQILRRGYSYADGVDRSADAAAGGLLFICYQRDPRRQFIPIQEQLAASDALNAHIEHVGSAIFACPPGAQPGGYVGRSLLG